MNDKDTAIINKAIIESLDTGIIVINRNNIIQLSNHKAQEMIGSLISIGVFHPPGRLKKGDIVIIADSCIGDDDGGLSYEDLCCLNINDTSIQQGNILLAAGIYNDPTCKPQYKSVPESSSPSAFTMECHYAGLYIKAEVNQVESWAEITVNKSAFRMNYFRSVGNIVVIDSKTHNIKFYQDKGYTIRKEPLKYILNGKPYAGKKSEEPYFDDTLLGKNADDIFEKSQITDEMTQVMMGRKPRVSEKFLEINKRMMICSIDPVRSNDEIAGIILRITDASRLEALFEHRNYIISQVENLQDKHFYLGEKNVDDPFPEIYGNSPAMRKVKHLAKKASMTKANVLITGESGTGKSFLARQIHNCSKPETPFVEVNCASIPQTLFESELFGYVSGAFTGALKSGKKGFFESANGGTLFLDEIGEIPIETQVKLLQALQTKKIYRIGSTKPVDIDIRVIAATNKDIESAIKHKAFRLDLYYRLNVFPIHMPPIRERISDIYIIANNILANICARDGIPIKILSSSAMEKIIKYAWPGNVRELENIIDRAVILCEGNVIYPEYIEIADTNINDFVSEPLSEPPVLSIKESVDRARKEAMLTALSACNGDYNEAMWLLKLSKTTFYAYLNKYIKCSNANE